jgi:hypothetical protein
MSLELGVLGERETGVSSYVILNHVPYHDTGLIQDPGGLPRMSS